MTSIDKENRKHQKQTTTSPFIAAKLKNNIVLKIVATMRLVKAVRLL